MVIAWWCSSLEACEHENATIAVDHPPNGKFYVTVNGTGAPSQYPGNETSRQGPNRHSVAAGTTTKWGPKFTG